MNSFPHIKSIFLIDDDIDDQDLFREALLLVAPATTCHSAMNGEEAYDYLRNLSGDLPDYIFLDLNLPRVNGKQCLSLLKTDERLQHIPVIIYSTSSQQKDINETIALGAEKFITKPCSFHELCTLLSGIIHKNAEAPAPVA